jgi:putative transcriptional regulator
MTPVHHPDEEELVGYASGTNPEWVSLVVACHLTYCPACRDDVELFDDLGGVLLDSLDVPEGGPLAARASEVAAKPRPPPVAESPVMAVQGLPWPLAPYLPKDGTGFRFLAPGLRHIPLDFSVGGVPARVIRFAAGFKIPEHRHQGLEFLLVLDGMLHDTVSGDAFRKGDVSRREPGTTHGQWIDKSEPCTCLVISAAPVVPSTLMGKILKTITGV